MKSFFCFFRLLMHTLGAFVYGTVVYPFIDDSKKNLYVQKWSRKLLDICGVTVKIVNPELLSPRSLIVANHVSWLDIFLIYSVVSGHFIAKADMAHWPMVGWLSRKTGTLFLERSSARNLKSTLETLVRNLQARERCIFFPEGTTGRQGNMLPFHPNLFEGAINAELPVQPFALKYVNRNGEYEPAVDSSGDISLARSMKNVFNSDYIMAELTILPVIDTTGMHRKALARQAQDVISSVLPANPPVPGNRDNPPETAPDRQDAQP